MYSFRWYYRRGIVVWPYKYTNFLRNYLIQFIKKKSEYRVFCIGYAKTGNTSITKALDILGFRSAQYLKGALRGEPKGGWIRYIKKCNYDAFIDAPFGREEFYKELDKTFPKSKFILTSRETSSFSRSFVNYFHNTPWEIKSKKELKELKERFEERNAQIIEYFKDRPSKLLIMDISSGDGWEKLCGFLENPIPKKPFPHRNKGWVKTG